MIFGVIVATTSSIYIGGPDPAVPERWWKEREAARSTGQQAERRRP